MIKERIKKKIKLLKHLIGFHNKKCKRRFFTEKNTYICLITGNKFRRINYELFRIFKEK
tara:strand:+ start:523 stop:699 length:177 start_codon:yes stop_codon:yes gene_type:complete